MQRRVENRGRTGRGRGLHDNMLFPDFSVSLGAGDLLPVLDIGWRHPAMSYNWYRDDGDEVLLNVLRCQLTYKGQVVTNAEARFNKSLRPRKPEGSLGRTAQDVHLDSHTVPELCTETMFSMVAIYCSCMNHLAVLFNRDSGHHAVFTKIH